MSSFLPIDVNRTGQLVEDLKNPLPAELKNKIPSLGQAGNNEIVNKLTQTFPGLAPIIQQGSAFPDKKTVTFCLKDRNGALLEPDGDDAQKYKKGYMFNMYVNPSSLSVTVPAKTINPIRTLGGWRVQHWYPDIGSIKGDGIIGNMLESFNKDLKDSSAWRGFLRLMKVYQKNGIPYYKPGTDRIIAQQNFAPTAVCVYSGVQYEGYFESLDYTESEDTPHTIKYSFSFRYLDAKDTIDIPELTKQIVVDASVYRAAKNVLTSSNAVNNIPGLSNLGLNPNIF
jgi:hypothetical protein